MKRHPNDFLGALVGKQQVLFFEKPSLRTRLTFRIRDGEPRAERRYSSTSRIAASMRARASSTLRTTSNAGSTSSCCARSRTRRSKGWRITLRYPGHQCAQRAGASVPGAGRLSSRYRSGSVTCRKSSSPMLATETTCAFAAADMRVPRSSVRIATPKGYEPQSADRCRRTGNREADRRAHRVLNDPHEAVSGADAIYTDAWASMGQEHESTCEWHFPAIPGERSFDGGSRAVSAVHALPSCASRTKKSQTTS